MLIRRIDDYTQAMPVPTGIVIFRTINNTNGSGVDSLFVPCSVAQRDEFFRGLPEPRR